MAFPFILFSIILDHPQKFYMHVFQPTRLTCFTMQVPCTSVKFVPKIKEYDIFLDMM